MNTESSFLIQRAKQIGCRSMVNHHFHNDYEIYYLVSGKKYYFIKDRTYLLNQGDLIFIPPYELHQTIDAGVHDLERILINFRQGFSSLEDAAFAEAFKILSSDENRMIRFNPQEQTFIESHLYKMLQEAANKPAGYRIYLKTLLIQLILYIYRHVESHSPKDFKDLSCVHQRVSKITQHLNDHFSEPLTLATVAKLFFISPFYLCRIFKEVTGFSFNEYLTSIRLKEAQKLLRETNLKVIKISESCGFGSLSHFGRLFKQATGVSPLQFRERR